MAAEQHEGGVITDIFFDAFIVVRDGRSHGEGVDRSEERETHFHSSDGWSIRETLPGVFSLLKEGMSAPMIVGGYGYSYLTMPAPETEEEPAPQKRKGKR